MTPFEITKLAERYAARRKEVPAGPHDALVVRATGFAAVVKAGESTMSSEHPASKLEILLEAARRATWDALKGPRHLKAGRFRSQPVSEERHPVGKLNEV